MKYIALILIFIVLSSNQCNKPYSVKTLCTDSTKVCRSLTLEDSLEIRFRLTAFDWDFNSIETTIIGVLTNPTRYVKHIDRNRFSVVSSKGIQFKLLPMQVAVGLGASSVPDLYPVAPGQDDDYVFVFTSLQQYSKKQALELLKNDTVSFLYNKREVFRMISDDGRIR